LRDRQRHTDWLEPQEDRADSDFITRPQRHRARDYRSIDCRTPAGAQIFHETRLTIPRDSAVLPRDLRMLQLDRAARSATDDALPDLQRKRRRLKSTSDDELRDAHSVDFRRRCASLWQHRPNLRDAVFRRIVFVHEGGAAHRHVVHHVLDAAPGLHEFHHAFGARVGNAEIRLLSTL